MNKSRINKQKGVLLKKLGWTNKQIAKSLDCSEIWCATNLSGIKPDYKLRHQAYVAYLKEPFVFEGNVCDLDEEFYKNDKEN